MRSLAFYPTAAIAIGAIAGIPYLLVRPVSLLPAPTDLSAFAIAGGWALGTAVSILALRRFRTAPVALMMLVSLRLYASLYLGSGWPGGSDQQSNLILAHNLAAGNGYSVPWRGATMLALYPPGYPLLLAGWSLLFGIGRASVLLLNSAVDLIAAAVLAVIIRPRGRRLALLCAALYLAWPDRIISSLAPNKEGLALLFVCLIIYSLDRRHAVLLGVSAALLALTQPAWLPFVGIAALLVLRFDKRLLVSAGVGALVMLPWWIRNYLVLHELVPLTTSGPYSVMVAATGKFDEFDAYLRFGELEGGRRAAADALRLIASSPVHFAFFRAVEITRSLCFDLEGISNLNPIPEASNMGLACQIYYAAVAGFAALKKTGGVFSYILLAMFAQIAIFAPWLQFDMRHKELIVVPLLLLAAPTISRWCRF